MRGVSRFYVAPPPYLLASRLSGDDSVFRPLDLGMPVYDDVSNHCIPPIFFDHPRGESLKALKNMTASASTTIEFT